MTNDPFLSVRRALGRSAPIDAYPVPPRIDEPAVRLVHTDFGLPRLFARTATQNHMRVELVNADEILSTLTAFLREHNCHKIGLPDSPFLQKFCVPQQLQSAGFDVRLWPHITLDDAYTLDCSVTDVYAAVAETGSLVIRPAPQHGRALSLAPLIHVAIAEPRHFVPDLLDLFEKLARDPAPGAVLINGPSRTADIEKQTVFGVHGPHLVQVFILQ